MGGLSRVSEIQFVCFVFCLAEIGRVICVPRRGGRTIHPTQPEPEPDERSGWSHVGTSPEACVRRGQPVCRLVLAT